MTIRAVRRALLTIALGVILLVPRTAIAQQRPLMTQDPETIGAGRVLLEGGLEFAHDAFFPLSGLTGDLLTVPMLGVHVGISSIADLQLTGGPYQHLAISSRSPAPLAGSVDLTNDSTHAVHDIEIGAKIRFAAETERRPAFGFRFSTRLPNAKHDSGLGQDTTDFSASLLVGKTIQSVRIAGNFGLTIMSEPLQGDKQNDVLTYGLSFARAMTNRLDVVGEVNGRVSTRGGEAPLGTESRSVLVLGGRYTDGPIRFDAGVFFGLTSVDPTFGFRTGVTYVFNAFRVP